jgi:hypothetical protein
MRFASITQTCRALTHDANSVLGSDLGPKIKDMIANDPVIRGLFASIQPDMDQAPVKGNVDDNAILSLFRQASLHCLIFWISSFSFQCVDSISLNRKSVLHFRRFSVQSKLVVCFKQTLNVGTSTALNDARSVLRPAFTAYLANSPIDIVKSVPTATGYVFFDWNLKSLI